MPVYRIYQVGSPFNASELAELDYEQTADVLYYAHNNHKPTKLIRAGHTDWSFMDIAFGPLVDVPATISATSSHPNTDADNGGNAYFPQPATYVVTAYNELTGQESRASSEAITTNDLALKRNYNTISWSAVTGATSYKVYKGNNDQSLGIIGITKETTFRDDNIGPDLSIGPPVGDDPFDAVGDHPGTVTFHEQRSIWGRTLNRPNAIWGSRSADYENMDIHRPLVEDDAFAIGLVANRVNSVQQLLSRKQGLLALTGSNIFGIVGANDQGYLAAVPPPRATPEISRGSSNLQPIALDSVAFYVTAKQAAVHTLGYEFEIDGVRTNDVTVFARHLFKDVDIADWAFAEKPFSCFLLVLSDGRLLILTWDQAQEVWGWTVCETDGLFKGVCTIFEQGEDRAYFIVERTINTVTKRYIERMASALWTDQADACYLDCARTFTNDVATAHFDRLDHLEGKEVAALVDGNLVTGLTVTGGAVTLASGGIKVTIGLPFTAEIETLPLAVQANGGWTVAKPQHINTVIVRVVDTRGISAGPPDKLRKVRERDTELIGAPTDLLTGDYELSMDGMSGNEATVVIQSSDPLPMTVSAILVDPDVKG
jgi:hypothetical protein